MAAVSVDPGVELGMWLWVPLAFPVERWDAVEAWSSELGSALAGADATAEAREQWTSLMAQAARMAPPSPDVVGRVLHVSQQGASLVVAHLLASPVADEQEGDVAMSGLASGGLQRLDAVEHPKLDEARHALAVGTLASGAPVVVDRRWGVRDGQRVLLEVVVTEPTWLAIVDDDLATLFSALDVAA